MPLAPAAPSFVEELMEAKKLQATELFGPWDREDEGRIAVAHLRPLLLSVFPPPTAPASVDSTPFSSAAVKAAAAPSPLSAATGLLSLARVKRAYEAVTGRPFSPPSSSAAASAAAPQLHRGVRDPVQVGPTLNEVHAIIDVLSRGSGGTDGTASVSTSYPPARALALEQSRRRAKEEQAAAAAAATAEEEEKKRAVQWGSVHGGRRIPSKSPLSPPTPAALAPVGFSRLADPSPAPVLDSRVPFLYGSIEAIYRAFCAAAGAPGEAVPPTLPLDTAHLERLALHVQSRPLRQGEARALRELFSAAPGGGTCLTLDAFVTTLCSL